MEPDTKIQANQERNSDEEDQKITPWEAVTKSGKFDYQKLIVQFGVDEITPVLLERFEKVTGVKPHIWLRRGMFFAHRNLNELLDDYEQGRRIFLYTGRGPSSDKMHLGHSLSFILTAWLQSVFKDAIVVIQMADQEKYWFKRDLGYEEVYRMGFENAKDIIAFGFDPDRTYIFSNRDHSRYPYAQKLVDILAKKININTLKKTFGIQDDAPVGCIMWPLYEIASAFSGYFEPIFGPEKPPRCLILYGCDQDKYFLLGRDVAESIGYPKPCSMMSQFLPALEGSSKMSTTGNTGEKTIFMTDTPNEVTNKIKKYAFSGGRDSKEEQMKKGARLDIDIPYQWLRYYEPDDQILEQIANDYGSGKMLTKEIKEHLILRVNEFIEKHQQAKAKVTPELVRDFYDINKFKKAS